MGSNADGTGICPSAKPNGDAFYRRVLQILDRQKIPFLIGGAYMLSRCLEIHRDTKDLDVFVRRRDFNRAIDVLASAGYQTEISFLHWLGKVFSGNFIDLIFSSGNGICRVDKEWAYWRSLFAGKQPLFLYENHLKKNSSVSRQVNRNSRRSAA